LFSGANIKVWVPVPMSRPVCSFYIFLPLEKKKITMWDKTGKVARFQQEKKKSIFPVSTF